MKITRNQIRKIIRESFENDNDDYLYRVETQKRLKTLDDACIILQELSFHDEADALQNVIKMIQDGTVKY